MGYYCDNVGGVEGRRRRRRVRFICECREMRGDRDRYCGGDRDRRGVKGSYSDWCGCNSCERERDRRRGRDRNGRNNNVDFVCECREAD